MSVAVMRIIPVDDHRVLSHWFCSEVLSCSVSVCISCELLFLFFFFFFTFFFFLYNNTRAETGFSAF